MKISVFGLGYVGTVSAACFAEMGHRVIGVDINPDKVRLIREGVSTVIEAELPDLVRRGVSSGRLTASESTEEAVLGTDVSLVCVGTPSADNGSLAPHAVESVMSEIGEVMGRKPSRHLVVLRSTVLPGTCAEVVIPRLEASSGRSHREDFGLVYNPEFLREGSSVKDFFHPPQTIVGTTDDGDEAVMQELYRQIEAPFRSCELGAAEMIKYVCNPFHALKVAFANEVGTLCRSLGIDAHEVMDLFLADSKLNLSSAYLRPGFAFGGSCLPKDVRALLYCAKQNDVEVPLLQSILPSNETHLDRGLSLILKQGRKRVGFLGLSFKAGTDDLRESPYVRLAETLIGKGTSLRIFDHHVSLSRLTGANRKYIENEIPHIAELLVGSMEELLDFAEVLVVTRLGDSERAALRKTRSDQVVVDLVGSREGHLICGGEYIGITHPQAQPELEEVGVRA